MPDLEIFLREAVVLLACAVGVLLLSARLRVPSLVGLLITGMLVGPSGLGWVAEAEKVEVFAEIGVVLLLFVIGLEVSVGQLRRLQRAFLAGGAIQAAITATLAGGAALAVGLAPRSALFFGLVLVFSSTAIVLKLYADRRETSTPHGRTVLAILLFQDVLVVPVIVVTPLISGEIEAEASALALRLGGSLIAVALFFFVARKLVPRWLELLVGTRMREVFVLGALGLCLGLAWLTESLGFSLALGAFLGGVLIAETHYSHQVIADVGPFRDVLTSIFFVSVGMLVELSEAWAQIGMVLLLAAGIVLLKAAVAAVAAALLRLPGRTCLLVALGLAQVGEFSFVVMEVGREHGLLGGGRFQLLLAAAVVTMLATPLLVSAAPRIAARVFWRPGGGEGEAEAGVRREGHVVLVGFGAAGSLLGRVLREVRIPYVAIELDAKTVQRARQRGEPIVFGDAGRREILQHAGIEGARLAVFALSDPAALRRGVRLARQLNRGLEIVVRTRAVGEIEELRSLGADHVVAEEFETAIELFTRVLRRFHVPPHLIRAQTRVLRGEGYEMLRAPALAEGVSKAVLDALTAGTAEIVQIEEGTAAAGATLRELSLRGRTGASVIAVLRGDTPVSNPSADLRLEAGDSLVLVGSHEEVDRAIDLLRGADPG